MLTVLLLAAGRSTRMNGANKLLLPFRGRTILETTLSALEAAALGDILVVLGHESGQLEPLLENRPCRKVFNPDFETGMSSSIRSGVAAARAGSTGYMICLADMPLITATTYRLLAQEFQNRYTADPGAIVRPQFDGQPGHPVLFSAAYREELLGLEFPEGARPVLQAHPEHIFPVAVPTDEILCDADTAEGYQRLLERSRTDSV